MNRIESINDWLDWAASQGIKKTAALALAMDILGYARSIVWQWARGEKNPNTAALHLLHIYAHPGDYYWMQQKEK